MLALTERRTRALADLQAAAEEARAYFATAAADLFDGYQTAHDVLASIVFWQCEHLTILQALHDHADPPLREGGFAAITAEACACQQDETMAALLAQFEAQHAALYDLLLAMPDWTQPFPLKQGGRPSTIEDRVFALAAAINQHVAALRRAELRQAELAPPKSRRQSPCQSMSDSPLRER